MSEFTATDRVRRNTPDEVNREIIAEIRDRLLLFKLKSREEISGRLEELDREWDVERMLETNAALFGSLGVLMAVARRSFLPLLLTGTALGFLMQHAVQGWCPPIEVFRRAGIRTRREIDLERYALKVIRGDFEHLRPGSADPVELADELIRTLKNG